MHCGTSETRQLNAMQRATGKYRCYLLEVKAFCFWELRSNVKKKTLVAEACKIHTLKSIYWAF